MARKKQKTKEEESRRAEGAQAKNPLWRTKTIAPSSWVETLLSGSRGGLTEQPRMGPNDEATGVLLEIRGGRNGAAMLADVLSFETCGLDAAESIKPLAHDLWERAQAKVAEFGLSQRFDARIKIVETDETGATHVRAESAWVQVPDDEGINEKAWDDLDFDAGDPVTAMALKMTQILGAQNKELFRANISLVRNAAFLVRESIAGQADRMNSEFATIAKVREISSDLFDARMRMAEAEGDAQEVTELASTARHWMSLAHEDKLAEKGVQAPAVPSSRSDAAAALWQSLTLQQLKAINEELGPEKSELLMGMLENAPNMTDEQIDQLFSAQFAGTSDALELMAVAEKVFSQDYVPSSWAIWQSRCARVLLHGPEGKAA